jgi:hypothetical protein
MGIPRLTVSKILNHVEQGVTAVYDRHSYDPEKQQALNAWAIRVYEVVNGDREMLGVSSTVRVSAMVNTPIGSSWTRGSDHGERSASDAGRVG